MGFVRTRLLHLALCFSLKVFLLVGFCRKSSLTTWPRFRVSFICSLTTTDCHIDTELLASVNYQEYWKLRKVSSHQWGQAIMDSQMTIFLNWRAESEWFLQSCPLMLDFVPFLGVRIKKSFHVMNFASWTLSVEMLISFHPRNYVTFDLFWILPQSVHWIPFPLRVSHSSAFRQLGWNLDTAGQILSALKILTSTSHLTKSALHWAKPDALWC